MNHHIKGLGLREECQKPVVTGQSSSLWFHGQNSETHVSPLPACLFLGLNSPRNRILSIKGATGISLSLPGGDPLPVSSPTHKRDTGKESVPFSKNGRREHSGNKKVRDGQFEVFRDVFRKMPISVPFPRIRAAGLKMPPPPACHHTKRGAGLNDSSHLYLHRFPSDGGASL